MSKAGLSLNTKALEDLRCPGAIVLYCDFRVGFLISMSYNVLLIRPDYNSYFLDCGTKSELYFTPLCRKDVTKLETGSVSKVF